MARRRNSFMTPPLPRAFQGYNESRVLNTIKLMATEQRWMATRHLKGEDLLNLFVPQQYRHSLSEAYKVGQVYPHYNHTMEIDLPEGYVMMSSPQPLVVGFFWNSMRWVDGFIAPKGAKCEIQPDAPPELVEKIEYVFREFSRISYEWGLVNAVFSELNTNGACNTPQQMRYVWPAIRHIVAKTQGMAELANMLVDSSARAGDKARVPLRIIEAMKPTVDIVNRTLLMDAVDMSESREFDHTCSAAVYDLGNGFTFAGMS